MVKSKNSSITIPQYLFKIVQEIVKSGKKYRSFGEFYRIAIQKQLEIDLNNLKVEDLLVEIADLKLKIVEIQKENRRY